MNRPRGIVKPRRWVATSSLSFCFKQQRTSVCCVLSSFLPSFPCWWALTDLSFLLYFSTEKWKKDYPESDCFHVLENVWKHWQVKGSCQKHSWGAQYSERKPFWWLKKDRWSQGPDKSSGKALPFPPKLVSLYFPVVIWMWFKLIMLQ